MKWQIKVKLKPGILDPQGKTVNHALHHLGFHQIKEVRIGKLMDIEMEDMPEAEARKILEEASRKLLANPVVEEFEIEGPLL